MAAGPFIMWWQALLGPLFFVHNFVHVETGLRMRANVSNEALPNGKETC